MPVRISKELQKRLFELTLALYRVTDFFPRDEALRRQLRERGNEILNAVTEYGYSGGQEADIRLIISRLEGLKRYLILARSAGLAKPINVVVLEREYDLFGHFFNKELELVQMRESGGEKLGITNIQEGNFSKTKEENVRDVHVDIGLSDRMSFIPLRKTLQKEGSTELFAHEMNGRKKAIIEHLKKSGPVKISGIMPIFSDISAKTIQRDLQDLVNQHILARSGERRWTLYSLK